MQHVKISNIPYTSVAVECSTRALHHEDYNDSCYRDGHCSMTFSHLRRESQLPESLTANRPVRGLLNRL